MGVFEPEGIAMGRRAAAASRAVASSHQASAMLHPTVPTFSVP